MSGGIILGGGDKPSQDEDDDREGDSRRVNVTNLLSLGHLVPWGGDLKINRIAAAEIRDRFKGKRIDLFVDRDLELMGEMLQHEAMATGHVPQGTPEEREAAFCQMIESAIQQITDCHVRRVAKPKPAAKDRRTYFVQFFPQHGGIVGSMSLGNVWFEIITKDLHPKPAASGAGATQQ